MEESKYQILTDTFCHGLFETNDSAFPGRLFTLTSKSLLNITNIPSVPKQPSNAEKDQKLKNILKSAKQEPVTFASGDSSKNAAAASTVAVGGESKEKLRVDLLNLVKSKSPIDNAQSSMQTDGNAQSSTLKDKQAQPSTAANSTSSSSTCNPSTGTKPSMAPSVIQFFNSAKQSTQTNDTQYFTPDQFV